MNPGRRSFTERPGITRRHPSFTALVTTVLDIIMVRVRVGVGEGGGEDRVSLCGAGKRQSGIDLDAVFPDRRSDLPLQLQHALCAARYSWTLRVRNGTDRAATQLAADADARSILSDLSPLQSAKLAIENPARAQFEGLSSIVGPKPGESSH